MEFDFDQEFDPFYIEGEPEKSHYFSGFSMVFPYLEPFMVRSVKEAMNHVEDEKLLDDMDKFCRQEAQHYQQHKRFNDRIVEMGYPGIRDIEEICKRDFAKLEEKPLKYGLAYAEGFECMGATAGLFGLKNGMLDNAKGVVGDLWRWHFCEELEHRTVAFDVYNHLYGSYFYKLSVSLAAQKHFVILGVKFANYLLSVDEERIFAEYGGKKGRRQRMLKMMNEQKGLMTKVLAIYTPWYTPHKTASLAKSVGHPWFR
jgi:hypothetical protein